MRAVWPYFTGLYLRIVRLKHGGEDEREREDGESDRSRPTLSSTSSASSARLA